MTAGDSIIEQSREDREVHAMGYDTLGKNTVLNRSMASEGEGEHARRELENFCDFSIRIFSCFLSDRSHAFHTPKYLDGVLEVDVRN